jgi:hypothetical protein
VSAVAQEPGRAEPPPAQDRLQEQADERAGDRGGWADRAVLTALFALSLGVYVGGRIAGLPNLSVGGAFGVLFFGVGTAPTQLSARAPLSARLGIAGLLGLSLAILIGGVMVLAPFWHPDAVAIVLLAAAGASHVAALPAVAAELRRWVGRPPGAAELRRRFARPSLLCTLAGTGLWVSAAISTGHISPRLGGFLPQITPLWYVGVVLVACGIALAGREEREGYAALAVTSLALALTVTPALVYGMPRSQSAAKHIEMVRAILTEHHLRLSDGIYAAYSGFFAGVAWLSHLSRLSDPIGVATYWPALMALIRLVELRFLFSRLIKDPYRRWVTIALIVLVDAIGADYFSPQAVGYVMGLGVFAVALSSETVIDWRLAGAVLLLSAFALAYVHELSPYIVGGVLVVLGALRCVRPRWLGLPFLAAVGLWAVVNWGVLGGYFDLSNLGRLSNFAPPSTTAAPGLSRAPIVALSSDALLLGILVLILLSMLGLWRHRRERWAWAYFISAGVGLVFVAVNPYGNEGIFRAALFGIPWLALLAATALRPGSRLLRTGAWAVLSVPLLATFLVGTFGMDASGVMRPADLAALRVFDSESPPGSYLIDLGYGDMPTGSPTVRGPTPITFKQVTTRATQLPGHPTSADATYLLERYADLAGGTDAIRSGQLYARWSPVLSSYAQEYGLYRPSQEARWRDLLLASSSWQVVYEHDGSYLFRAVAPAKNVKGVS